MGMADDLVKIRKKRFWGQRILGDHKAQVERWRGGRGSIIANRVLDCFGYLF